MKNKAGYYIETLKLKKHPEGGYYKEIYRAGELILPEHLPNRYGKPRAFSTSIYFLLEGRQFSSFHKLKSDELWHFYDGTSVLVYILNENGELKIHKAGREMDKGDLFQLTIEKNNWFAAELEDKTSFALIGCTVSPGFEFSDFKMGKREELINRYPEHKSLIERLTY